MDNCKVPSYPVSKEDILKDGGYYDTNGLWNSIEELEDGKIVRHRVETFIFKETSDDRLQVFLRKYNDGTYRLPGGSITKGVSDKVQALLECQEEARIKVKDIEYTGVHYIKINEKNTGLEFIDADGCIHWDGSYNDVYAGFYDGPYNGNVNSIDQDNDMYKNGKFYIIDDNLLSIISPEHKPIFDRLKQVGLLEVTVDELNGSEKAESDIDKKAIELCVFAGNFLTRCKDNTITVTPVPHTKTEDMYAVANYQCYSNSNMMKFIDLLNELNNTKVMKERYKDDNFGVIIPNKDAYTGTLFLKCGMVVSENAGLHDDDPIYTVKPKEDWLDTVLSQDDTDEHRKKLVDLGIEPDADIPIGEAAMIADKIISSCTEGIIGVNEKYIFSEKDGFYNFDKWDSGESNIMFITGLSGSGKTTKAKALVKQYKATYIQLDEFQCYNANKNMKEQTTTSRLISIYLKENPDIDSAKFTELTAEDFPNYFIPFFDWLMERLSTDKDNKYIIEGLHICLYISYNTIREYPLYCINTSMTKSIIRHWIRDGWSFRDFLKHGLVDIKLFEEWERQYSSFKDSIDESYIEESYLLPRIDKRKLSDEKYVKELIKNINGTPDKIYKKRMNVETLVTWVGLISLLSIVSLPLAGLMYVIFKKLENAETKESEKAYLVKCIDKYIERLKKQGNDKDTKEMIKKLEHNKKVISMNDGNNKNKKPSSYSDGYMKINGISIPSLAALYYDNHNNISVVNKYLEKWKIPEKNMKDLYFDSFIEEIIARGFNEQKLIEYIKVHEGDSNSIVKDIEKSGIKTKLQGKTLTAILDSDSDCIFYCSEDKCCYSLNLNYEDNFKKFDLSQVLHASYKGYEELQKIKKYSIDESYIEESLSNSKSTLFHLSFDNLDNVTLQPRIPSNFLTINGYEDNVRKRVCFSPSIKKCLRAMSQNLTGKELYVHIPISNRLDVYKPKIKEVPDSKITGEVWVMQPVKIKCIGKIKVDKASDKDGMKYNYGNNTAELYDWDYHWIEKVKETSYIEEKSEEYGLPEKKKYPMPDKKHVFSAIRFFNYVDKEDEKELAENIKKKMKYYKIDSSHVGENNRLKKYL